MSPGEQVAAQDQRLPWPTVRCVDCNNLYEIPVVETPNEFLRQGSILAAGQCPKCGSPTFSNLPEDRSAAQGRDGRTDHQRRTGNDPQGPTGRAAGTYTPSAARNHDGFTPVFLLAHDYGTHHHYCEILQNATSDNCTCGFAEAVAAALASERRSV